MRILVLHKYGQKSASCRHRVMQYLPYLKAEGYLCDVSSLLDDSFIEYRYLTGQRSVWGIVRAVSRRLSVLWKIRSYDLIIIGVELFPYCPAVFERIFNRLGIPFIFDFDDPIFHYYDLHRWKFVRWALGMKIAEVCRRAAVVFAGSPYLAEYASRAGRTPEYLPTVIDLGRYDRIKSVQDRDARPFIIGWIGSPTTAKAYLPLVESALREFCTTHRAKLVMVGDGGYIPSSGIPFESRPWSEGSEIEELLSFDVGIMPLSNDSWSKGKCGFKLIQYMACGLPVICSPVGANTHIVEEGVSGLFASHTDEWVDALQLLAGNLALTREMGLAGRRRVELDFCVQKTAPRFLAGVKKALASATRSSP